MKGGRPSTWVSRLSRPGLRLSEDAPEPAADDPACDAPGEALADPAVLHRLVVAEEPGDGVSRLRVRATAPDVPFGVDRSCP
jgi:hypothetical protein